MELRFHGNGSLKGKRALLRPLIERTRARFGCAIAETGRNDEHQAAEIGISVVGNDRAFVNGVLDRIAHYVDSLGLGEVTGQDWELFNL